MMRYVEIFDWFPACFPAIFDLSFSAKPSAIKGTFGLGEVLLCRWWKPGS